jgi:hypothetical protein
MPSPSALCCVRCLCRGATFAIVYRSAVSCASQRCHRACACIHVPAYACLRTRACFSVCVHAPACMRLRTCPVCAWSHMSLTLPHMRRVQTKPWLPACAMCGGGNPFADDSAVKWECAACSFHNKEDSTRCVMCGLHMQVPSACTAVRRGRGAGGRGCCSVCVYLSVDPTTSCVLLFAGACSRHECRRTPRRRTCCAAPLAVSRGCPRPPPLACTARRRRHRSQAAFDAAPSYPCRWRWAQTRRPRTRPTC